MADKWTSGLAALDARQTRQRLAALIDECRFAALGLEQRQGEGLRDQVAETKLTLLRAAKSEIERLAGQLAEYRSGPPALYDAFAAARARAEAAAAAAPEAAPEPQPEPARAAPEPVPAKPAGRPVLPVRSMRLPPTAPGRSA